MSFFKQFWLYLVIVIIAHTSFAAAPDYSKLVELVAEGKVKKAYNSLLETDDKEFEYTKLSVKYMALGEWASKLERWSEARAHLENALKYGALNAATIHYLIGHTYKEEKEYQKAIESFQRALDFNPAQNIVYQSRFELSEIYILQNKPARARDHLSYLEKRWRGTPRYPEVIWSLMGVEVSENRRHLVCRWARKLFAKHPGHKLVADWGVELNANKYQGQTIGCLASAPEIKERIRNLNLSGRADKSRSEIDFLRARARGHEKYDTDLLMANFLENQGFPEDAFKILIPYYEQKKFDLNYQNLLGKISARAGEYQAAIGAYLNAYKIAPNSKHGRNALFTSAFLSYQIQDYDGATRRFQKIADKYAGSGLARDSKWHLAWLRYLRQDFSGAESSFRALLKEKYQIGRRRKRTVRPFDDDRTRYWLAMSLFKQEKITEARDQLRALAEQSATTYYSIAARNRMMSLPNTSSRSLASLDLKIEGATGATSRLDNEKDSAEAVESSNPKLLFSPSGEAESAPEDSEATVQAGIDSEEMSADDVSSNKEENESEGPKLEAATDSGDKSEPASDETDKVNVTAFRDPRLQERFNRANNLIQIGLYEDAKWELFEIERRTSNRTYLRMLMEAYYKIGSYNRVTYISEVYFSGERNRQGFQEARDLWTYNFPKAYNDNVLTYSGKFNVPEPLILAIMRAESSFNKDAFSPVGARGLMQVMPYTATQLTRILDEPNVSDDQLLLPEVNIKLGTSYLSRLQKKFQNLVPLVAAGYNAGPHRVFSWLNTFGNLEMDEFIEHVPFVETRNYMKKVVRNYAIYNKLYSNKDLTYDWLVERVPMRVTTRPSPRENWDNIY